MEAVDIAALSILLRIDQGSMEVFNENTAIWDVIVSFCHFYDHISDSDCSSDLPALMEITRSPAATA
jgi:hypothetical protein